LLSINIASYVETEINLMRYLRFSSRRLWRILKNLSLFLTNQALRHENVWGSGCIVPCILDLGTNWR
jgi:hypothetical protein